MADDIILKEIETDLHESIEKFARINKIDNLKTKKETRKEKRINRKLEQIWNDRQSQKFWTKDMKLIECDKSIYLFYPKYDIDFK